MAHPHRKDVHKGHVAKCKNIIDPLDRAVVAPEAPSWDQYGTAKPAIAGNRKYDLGAQAPPFDAGNNTRMLNKAPKEYGG